MKQSTKLIGAVLFFILFISHIQAFGWSCCRKPFETVKDTLKAPADITKSGVKIVTDSTGKAFELTDNVATEIGKGGHILVKGTGQTIQNVTLVMSKGVRDTWKEAGRVPGNVGDALETTGQLVKNRTVSTIKVISEAEYRLREGKILDALFHAAIDPYRYESRDFAIAASDNSILNAIGSAAASANGGPAGAAAYAAWLTYNQTKDPDQAIRVGAIAGLTSLANEKISKITSVDPTKNKVSEITAKEITATSKKAIMSASVAGMAIAASGGNDKAIRRGALLAGTMVLVSDGYKKYTGDPLDGRGVDEPGEFCMTPDSLDAKCAPPKLALDKNNNPLRLDSKGRIYESFIKANGEVAYIREGVIVESSDMAGFRYVGDVRSIPERSLVLGKAHSGNLRTWAGIWEKPDKYKELIEFSKEQLILEGGAMSRTVAEVPAFRAMSVMHDLWMVDLRVESNLLNVGTIPVAVGVTYLGTPGPTNAYIQRTGANNKTADRTKPAPPDDILKEEKINTEPSFICSKGSESRYIGLRTGKDTNELACAVIYEKLKANETEVSTEVPWAAFNQKRYCNGKPKDIADFHVKEGWDCKIGAL